MNSRIQKMTEELKAGKMWFEVTPTEYDRTDLLLPPVQMSAKRVYEYIMNQKPQIMEYSALAGYIRFDGSVEGDAFNLSGHKNVQLILGAFYNQPFDNLVTLEWQHSVGDFSNVMHKGIDGVKEEIQASQKVHTGVDEQLFLCGLNTACDAIVGWANKCSDYAAAEADKTTNLEYKKNLTKLSKALKKIPQKPAESFYEAVLCIYICYAFIPDSIGTIDRHLYQYYKNDIQNGILTEEEAAAYLQELFLMLQSKVAINDYRFYRGGESHFCIGGYLPDGSDGFNELSYLIVNSLMDLPTYIPQISLRWTKKTPHEVLCFMMDCERKDPNKRIAFVSDEPRIKAFTKIAGLTYEDAVNYCMCGCNEPALQGGRIMGSSQQNIARSMSNTFKNRTEEIMRAESFEDFYKIYEEELFFDMAEMLRLDDAFNLVRARDCNLISSIFFKGCIENAKSVTQGGVSITTATMDLIGITTVIDSLAIIKQFVYDEKRVSMEDLASALANNWVGYDELHTQIMNKGKFFGNDDDETNKIAQRFTDSMYRFLSDKTDFMGKKFFIGDLIGYNQHNVWFGEQTSATPDGRHDGDQISFGCGQSEGKDRNGLTALLNSVAQYDPHCLMNGPSVTNILLDEQLVKNDDNFEKLVTLFETYFKNGGLHFQLSYVAKEDLITAKKLPDKYKSLRVRVSGFSDFFVNLNNDLQDEIITRTSIGA